MASSDVTVPFFKKKKARPTTTRRQREPSPPAGSVSMKSEVILPQKKSAGNLLSAGTKRTKSQRDDDDEEPERDGPDVKWKADNSHINAALEILAGDEAEEILAKRQKTQKDSDDEDAPDDGQYHGQKAYKSHLKKNKEVPKAMRVGPQRSTNTIRTVTVVDYQPDVCKDYKETGYCGFGDTCKFLHDRGTYLAGWQLDKLAENVGDGKNDEEDDSSSDEEDIPFACLICRKPYTDPIVTRCGHYFCSACAIKRFSRTPRCLACGAPTAGIFNRADKVIEKMNKKRKAKEERDREGDDGSPPAGVEIEGLANDNGATSSKDEDSD
ncbi:hypothetical protein FISHEDRAFT_71771 [Fistulina hepatica ATCC 64428]|uniref:Pre-mRNA-splicing factor CWC24 n=1 Tax=Fistulina hepatica ATCC 64428 TaxID=1128425 RepID=A0A0D7AG69_9AGAR|nr:hypothetical protein FISHEDRAFT_71771 [Fistulina hepatica ATCC 64428]